MSSMAQHTQVPPVNLADAEPGMTLRVRRVGGAPAYRNRLMELGLTAGTIVHFVRAAPFGDPIELDFRGYRLTLRRRESAAVEVDLI